MYQVVKMFGDWEPWWFIEGWEEDITEIAEYDTYQKLCSIFKRSGIGDRKSGLIFKVSLVCWQRFGV